MMEKLRMGIVAVRRTTGSRGRSAIIGGEIWLDKAEGRVNTQLVLDRSSVGFSPGEFRGDLDRQVVHGIAIEQFQRASGLKCLFGTPSRSPMSTGQDAPGNGRVVDKLKSCN